MTQIRCFQPKNCPSLFLPDKDCWFLCCFVVVFVCESVGEVWWSRCRCCVYVCVDEE